MTTLPLAMPDKFNPYTIYPPRDWEKTIPNIDKNFDTSEELIKYLEFQYKYIMPEYDKSFIYYHNINNIESYIKRIRYYFLFMLLVQDLESDYFDCMTLWGNNFSDLAYDYLTCKNLYRDSWVKISDINVTELNRDKFNILNIFPIEIQRNILLNFAIANYTSSLHHINKSIDNLIDELDILKYNKEEILIYTYTNKGLSPLDKDITTRLIELKLNILNILHLD